MVTLTLTGESVTLFSLILYRFLVAETISLFCRIIKMEVHYVS